MKPTPKSAALRCGTLIAALLASFSPNPAPAQTPPAEPRKMSEAKLERLHRNNKRKAEEMMARDSRVVSPRDMSDLEQTYQTANRNTRSPEAIEALKKVLEKYPKSNRAGCAALYLGRWTQGEEQERYLKLAVDQYSKSYYLDGTSVGGLGRLVLGNLYKQSGKEAEANKLFDEIRKDYADAQGHSGELIAEQIPK